MFLKNTFNVFSSNFTLTFRLLLFKIFVALSCVAIGFATILPLLEPVAQDMQSAGVFDVFALISSSVKDSTLFTDSVSAQILQTFVIASDILAFYADSLIAIYFALALLVLIWYLGSSAIDVAICEVINYFCKQKSKRSLLACFISRFVDVCKYTFFKLFLILPIEICIFALAFFTYIWGVGGIFSTTLSFAIIYALLPLKDVFTCLLAPRLVNSNEGIFASFKHGCKLSLSKWVKVYSTNLFIMIVGMTFCFLAGTISFGALAIIAFPIYMVFYKCYTMVLYYNLEGVRFYSDSETIVTPYILKIQEGDYTVDLL